MFGNSNIVVYIYKWENIYIPHIVLLHILYVPLQILKHINSIIKYNIVPQFYCPHVTSLSIVYLHLQIFKYINCIINIILSHVILLIILYIHIQTLSTVLSTVILSYIHVSPY